MASSIYVLNDFPKNGLYSIEAGCKHSAAFYYSTVESFEFVEANFLRLSNFQRFLRILFQFNEFK